MHFIDLVEISELQREMVARWHQREVDNPYGGLLGIVCRQMSYNFLLWHEEDIARSPDVSDARIAQVKRAIDKYNQQRNDWIEKIDDWLTDRLAELHIICPGETPQNTETLGSAIDRLSILALRIYHLQEQRDRVDATAEHRESVARKLAIAEEQLADLTHAAQELADDLFAGRKRHKTYRALKMYNDPALNPYLYQAQKAVA